MLRQERLNLLHDFLERRELVAQRAVAVRYGLRGCDLRHLALQLREGRVERLFRVAVIHPFVEADKLLQGRDVFSRHAALDDFAQHRRDAWSGCKTAIVFWHKIFGGSVRGRGDSRVRCSWLEFSGCALIGERSSSRFSWERRVVVASDAHFRVFGHMGFLTCEAGDQLLCGRVTRGFGFSWNIEDDLLESARQIRMKCAVSEQL